MTDPRLFFTDEEVERARRYHRPRYLALLADLALGQAVLAAVAFTGVGDALYEPLEGLHWAPRTAVFAAAVVVLAAAVGLPVSFWSGHVHEHRWGFSTQGWGG